MLCQIWSNMKIANNPVKYAVVIEQYLHSILDISDQKHWQTLLTLGASLQTYIPLFQFLKWSKVHFFNNIIANFPGKACFKFSKEEPTPSQVVQKINMKCVEVRRPPRSCHTTTNKNLLIILGQTYHYFYSKCNSSTVP